MNEGSTPVASPDGQMYAVRAYRSGSLARFPSAQAAPAPGGVVVAPLYVLGWLLHLTVFRRAWSVEAAPCRNLPGPKHRERAASQDAAITRVSELRADIASGAWPRPR